MNRTIRIGTRESQLAVAQAELVKQYLETVHPQYQVTLVKIKTTGDQILDRSLDQIGGKGLFVKELDIALYENRTDLSVHSLKDLPIDVLKLDMDFFQKICQSSAIRAEKRRRTHWCFP